MRCVIHGGTLCANTSVPGVAKALIRRRITLLQRISGETQLLRL